MSSSISNRFCASLFLAAIGAGTFVSVSSAAPVLQLDRPCYISRDTVTANANGFSANTKYSIALDGKDLGNGNTDSQGVFSGAFAAPAVTGSEKEKQFAISANVDGVTANANLLVTKLEADFKPTTGDIRTMRVNFSGRGLVEGRMVYLHYVKAKTARQTVTLGATKGLCGEFVSKKLRLFPFDPSTGVWTLRIDNNRSYSAKHPGVSIRLRVREK